MTNKNAYIKMKFLGIQVNFLPPYPRNEPTLLTKIMGNAVAVNVLATAGTIFWCVQLIPQIIRNFKVKNCEGMPPIMLFLWAAAGVPFSIYFVGIDGSIPLRIQPQLFTFLCAFGWVQCLYYPPVKLPLRKIILYAGSFTVISIAMEIGFILWLRPVYRHGTHWPMLIFGIIASILIAVGLFPPYFELAKRKGRVVGINFVFIFLDSMGALLSMLSILVGTFDAMSMVLYVIVLVLEIGIFMSHIIWWLRLGRRAGEPLDLLGKDLHEEERDGEEEGDAVEAEGAREGRGHSVDVRGDLSGGDTCDKESIEATKSGPVIEVSKV